MQERNSNVSQSYEVLTFHVLVQRLVDGSIVESILRVVDVMTYFKDRALSLQVIEDLGVHLDLELIGLLEDRIETVVEHASRLLRLGELSTQILVFIKH